MKWRYIKVGSRSRMMNRSNSAHDLIDVETQLHVMGFIRVKFISYWLHVINENHTPKKDFYGNPQTNI